MRTFAVPGLHVSETGRPFYVITFAIGLHVEQTLTHVPRTSLAARNSSIRNQSFHRFYNVHTWMVHLRHDNIRPSVCDSQYIETQTTT